ncbi:MAG TPA: hypothetical protein VG900_08325 [Hyphomicrobiaceae bacterium]|jgi:hypothetical protein|nr:hypothetical protein [Hyphomicrobiaceae bacterium]
MASPSTSTQPDATGAPASYLDLPAERRAAYQSHTALLCKTAAEIARELPLQADETDFARVLTEEARP